MRHGLIARQVGARLAEPISTLLPRSTSSSPSGSAPHRVHESTPGEESSGNVKIQRPDARPRPRIPDPFRRFSRLQVPPGGRGTTAPLSERLQAVDHIAFSENPPFPWPRYAVIGVLTGPTDRASLIRVLPIVLRAIETKPLELAIEVARRVLKPLRKTRLLPVVPPIIDALLARLQTAYDGGDVDKAEIMVVVDRMLEALDEFRVFSTIPEREKLVKSKSLTPTIEDQVFNLAYFAIEIAESSPSTSSSPCVISDELRQRLFSHVLSTPQLRQLLLSHIPRRMMTPAEWRACTYSVIVERGPESAEQARVYAGSARKDVTRGDRTKSAEKKGGKLPPPPSSSGQGAVDRITLARIGITTQSVIQTLEPFLDNESDSSDPSFPPKPLQPYAWSILLERLSSSPHVTAGDLLDTIQGLAEDLTIPHIMTPIVTGLAARGELDQAWEVFTHVCEKQKVPHTQPGRYVDRHLLAAATPICGQLFGASAAVQLVDSWARRPKPLSEKGNWQQSIILDPHNLNVLLSRYIRAERPSVPLRLMAAALPRWGVWPDHISLNILLDCCRFSPTTQIDEPDTIRSRIRELVGEIHLFKAAESSPAPVQFDAASLVEKDYRVLVDPEGATWRETMGELRPWQYARQVFRDVIFGNWPHLMNIHSPLEFGTFARLEDILLPYDPPQAGEFRIPAPMAQYTHLIPVPATFQSYITLLGYYNLVEDIPTALAWARELSIEPNWKSMCSALAYIGEVEGPRRRVRGWYDDGRSAFARDEEIMRRWLEEWVRGDVPTEADVARFVRSATTKGRRMSAGRWGKDE